MTMAGLGKAAHWNFCSGISMGSFTASNSVGATSALGRERLFDRTHRKATFAHREAGDIERHWHVSAPARPANLRSLPECARGFSAQDVCRCKPSGRRLVKHLYAAAHA